MLLDLSFPRRVWLAFYLFTSAVILSATSAARADERTPFHGAGAITVTISEDMRGASELHYAIEIENKRLLPLVLPGNSRDLESGQRVEVAGELVRDDSGGEWIEAVSLRLLAAAAVDGGSARAGGARRALALRVNFRDMAVSCSSEQIAGILWSNSHNVNGLYETNSFGQVSFPSDTNGDGRADVIDVTIDVAAGGGVCNYYSWAGAANSAAAAQGVDLASYQHRIYVLPANVPCGWAGMANVGCAGDSCAVWVKTCSVADVYAHELGHNLGMQHAATDHNNDGAVECGYCNTSCVMGYGGVGWRHFNGIHKAQMNWIPVERRRQVLSSARFTLVPVEQDPDRMLPAPPVTTQILTVPVPGESTAAYYVSYRSSGSAAYSENLDSSFRNRVSIHRRDGDSPYSLLVAAIAAGETFSDGKGVSVTLSKAGALAEVAVVAGNAPLPPEEPQPGLPLLENPQPPVTPLPVDPTPLPESVKRYAFRGKVTGAAAAQAARLRVVAINAVSGKKRRATVGSNGRFHLLLSAGRYILTLERPGRRRSSLVMASRSVTVPKVGLGYLRIRRGKNNR